MKTGPAHYRARDKEARKYFAAAEMSRLAATMPRPDTAIIAMSKLAFFARCQHFAIYVF